MSSPNGPSGTSSFFTGFTRLCKGLALVLFANYIVVTIIPPSLGFLALIPAKTIPFAWNLITAGFVEHSAYGVISSIVCLLITGKLLEPVWGSREFLKFTFIVNILTCVCVFVTCIALYFLTSEEIYLYRPISGFQGVLFGLLVGIKQLIPDSELPVIKLKAKWFPSIAILTSIAAIIFARELISYLPVIIFGTYISWIYLRYIQKKPETKLRGDPSSDFAFSSFFPEFLRPLIDPISLIFHRLLCGRLDANAATDESGVEDGTYLGSDPIEATRRRERGARALEERLAVARSAEDNEPV